MTAPQGRFSAEPASSFEDFANQFDPGGLAASFKTGVISWLLLPVYVWQGLQTRRRVLRMVPPMGRTSGCLGAETAGDAEVKLLVIGDSSAAGVGVDRIDDSLGPKLAERIAALDGVVRIRRETSGRKGKGVTTVHGVPLAHDELKALAKTLKKRCGTGGAIKAGVIVLHFK